MGWDPAPTEAPDIGLEFRGLFPRQTVDTCGFVNGSPYRPVTCQSGRMCAKNTYLGVAGCCASTESTCSIDTTCVPSSRMSRCTAASCLSNDHVMKCYRSAAPYCYTMFLESSTTTFTAYGCTSEDDLTQTILLSSDYDSSSSVSTTRSTSTTSTTSWSSTSESSRVVFSPPETNTNGDEDYSGGSSTNVGAIVGGVIGAIGGLALLGLAGAYLYLRRRRGSKGNAPVAAAEYKSVPGGGPLAPAPATVVDPRFSAAQGPQQQPYNPHGGAAMPRVGEFDKPSIPQLEGTEVEQQRRPCFPHSGLASPGVGELGIAPIPQLEGTQVQQPKQQGPG
ncbi:hypothetical protein BDY21DRAFT_361367 [Lineolata rhizophorae]|uniref:Mid2 domain-containing protein n=1 Tax=Lineolata rhizophorae TaxID=578093 RepID=A0A6A6P957_9PEZI|nr:hypothetical protein BDY21DRAFT_361367 [Lineolata rhizophorae]